MNPLCKTIVAALMISSAVACVEPEDESFDLETQEQEIRGGSVYTTVPSAFEAVGRIPGCTATLVSEFAALTAAHCVNDGASVTFTAPNGRGSITGTAKHHPLFEDIKWLSHDYAIIKFPHSIHAEPGLNATGLNPIPVDTKPMSAPAVVRIMGYGLQGAGCTTSSGGTLAWTPAVVNDFLEDWHYEIDDSVRGTCPGDSGGPELRYRSGSWRVVGVTSWSAGASSYHKISYAVAAWVREEASRPDLPGNTWGNCVIYNGTSPSNTSYASYQGNHANLNGWSNYASSVWVEKGFEMIAYDGINYSNELGRRDGFNGDQCNEHGCFHVLTGAMNNSISSLKCSSDLPGNTWGHCVMYDRFPNTYLSVQGHHATLNGGNWNNRAKQIWVKKNHTATIYPETNYAGNGYWGSRTLTGSSGDWCNAYGCLHDLVGTRDEATIGSMKCN